MSIVELLLGWLILTALGIGSIVAAEPFWGPRRARRQAVLIRLDTPPGALRPAADEKRRAA